MTVDRNFDKEQENYEQVISLMQAMPDEDLEQLRNEINFELDKRSQEDMKSNAGKSHNLNNKLRRNNASG